MEMVEFLSPEWIELFRSIIAKGLESEDLQGIEFSMYEDFKNVPAHRCRDGLREVCFGFSISGGRLRFFDKPPKEATIAVTADYEGMAPWVSLPLSQTKTAGIMDRLHAAGKVRIRGDLNNRPKFLERLRLHDRLAEFTKPYIAKPSWEV